MAPRFWTHPPLAEGIQPLSESEAHHARTVLRLVAGTEIEVFDGDGRVAPARLIHIDKKAAKIAIHDVKQIPKRRTMVTLATAVPKGDRFDWIVEKATELGVDRLVPLKTERSVVEPRSTKLDRLRQLALSACKQSGRNTLLQIDAVTELQQLFQADRTSTKFLFSDRCDTACSLPAMETSASLLESAREVIGIIGPEGGWTPSERQIAQQFEAAPVSLGPHVLRIETAAIVLGFTLCQLADQFPI